MPPTSRGRLHAAYLAVEFGGRDASRRKVAVSSCCAADLLGWEIPSHRPIPRLITPADVRADSAPAIVRRVCDWPRRQFAVVDGLVTTVPADTLLDIAPDVSDATLLALTQAELHRRPSSAVRVASRCREGVIGSTRMRVVLGRLEVGVDSVLHRYGHAHLRTARLPRPECGLEVLPRTGERDCVLRRPGAVEPPWGMVVNWDGDIHRVSRRKYSHDRAVDRQLRRGGWASVRYGWQDHEEPADMYEDMTTTWALVSAGPRSWL